MKASKPLPKNFWTQVRIVKCIKALKKDKHPLTVKSIWDDRSRKTTQVLFKVLRVKASGAKLYLAALRHFGSWDRTLIEAGINAETIRQKPFSWNTRNISKILRTLHSENVPINAGNFSHDRTHKTREIIYQCTGHRKTGARIYHITNESLGSYNHVLKSSGFKLSQIRKIGFPCNSDKEEIIHYIRIFNKHKVQLNRTSVTKNTHKMKLIMEDTVGKLISGQSVFKAAESVFGNWDTALWRSGLDPSKIRLKSRPHTSSMPVIDYQVEDIIVDGNSKTVKYFGNAFESPEERLQKDENIKNLRKATQRLSNSDQNLIEHIYDAMSEVDHWSTVQDLYNQLSFNLDHKISFEKFHALLNAIQNNYN